MLQRTLAPGDVVRVDGPCEIYIRRRRGQLTAHFKAPYKTRVTHRQRKRRLDKGSKRRSN